MLPEELRHLDRRDPLLHRQEERMGQLEVRQFSKMKGRSHRLVADWEVISIQLGEASLSRSDPLRLELPVVVHVSEHD